MLNPALGDAPARWTVLLPTSTVTEPPTRSYERISVEGGGASWLLVVWWLVVGVGGCVVVVLALGTVVVDDGDRSLS